MNSSTSPAGGAPPVHFVAEGGVPFVPVWHADPTIAFEDLMQLVEALCPVWPSRPIIQGGVFLL